MLVKRFGRIINIVSLSGIKGMPGQTNYSAAKGGMIAATKALAQEVARKHVTVNAVAPGFIRTDMTNGIDEMNGKTDTGRTVRRTRRSSRTGRLPGIGTSLLYHRRGNFHQWRNLYISRR